MGYYSKIYPEGNGYVVEVYTKKLRYLYDLPAANGAKRHAGFWPAVYAARGAGLVKLPKRLRG